MRRSHDTAPGEVAILFFGALTRQKRPERFIRLVSRLAAADHPVVGWVLGDGPARGEMEALAGELGVAEKMRFLGYQERVADPVAAADLFVSTSDSEGIPAAVLEAGYLELPVVGFAVGGMDECVRHGETGLLAEAGDEDALLDLAARLVRDGDERRRLGAAARRFVADTFSMRSVGRSYEAFYRRVLAGGAEEG